jgi:VWFA-related protein
MRRKLWWILPLAAGFTIWAAAGAGSGAAGNGGAPQSQANPPSPEQAGTVLKAEARLVLVDAVVTDKKGAYVRDLTVKDFRVYEDNKEQKITSFAFEADPAIQNPQPHYMVLFFDDLSMPAPIDQANARQAAVKFVEKNASPTTMIAVVDFNGQFKITQNFTANVEKLKKAVVNLKLNIGPGIGDASFSLGGMDFGLNNDLDARNHALRHRHH